MRETPAEKLIQLLRNAGAEVSYHDPLRARVRRHDVGAARAARPTTASRSSPHHSGIDYGDVVERGARHRRLPQRDEGPRGRRQGLEALGVASTRVGSRRARLLGPEPRPQLRRARRARLDLRPRRRAARRVRRCAIPGAQATADFDDLLADDDARRGRHRDAGADALRAREAGARGRQARLRREAAGDARRRDGRARRARRGARPRADARPPAALPPRRAEAEGADRLGRARRRALRLRQPAEPRHRPHERERALVARRARPVGDPLPARRGSRGRRRARPRLPDAGRRGRRLLLPALPQRARSRTCTSRGSTRTRCGS